MYKIFNINFFFVNTIKLIYFYIFEQPRFSENGFEEILCSRRFNNRQRYVLKQLWKWRDVNARKHDESLHYVLPNHMMLQIAEVLPKEIQGIIACCSPVPPFLKHDIMTVFKYEFFFIIIILIYLFRFITTARNMKLQTFNESETEFALNNSQVNNANIINNNLLNSNRITNAKAKLEYNFDYTHFKPDENIPCVNERLNALQLSNKKVNIKNDSVDEPTLEHKEKKELDKIFDKNITVSLFFNFK